MTVLTDEARTARKRHQCVWCGEKVEPGDKYRYYSGIHDGDFQSAHLHPECYDAMQDEASEWESDYEFEPYSNPRGRVSYERPSQD